VAHYTLKLDDHSTGNAIFTDLDGTLLDEKQRLSPVNRKTLHKLGEDGVCRVVITGRTLFSACRVLDSEFPIDLLVTSSGAGIFNFPGKKLLHSTSMKISDVRRSAILLKELALNFMIHAPLPDNHIFLWHKSLTGNLDFDNRLKIYEGYHKPLPKDLTTVGEATQLLIVCPKEDNGHLHPILQTKLSDLTVIRTTSPLDHSSVWYEIFPQGTSKAGAAAWICNHHKLNRKTSLAIGNDYNDLDLLLWSNFSRIVENAPLSLRRQFTVVPDNKNNGFSKAVADWRQSKLTCKITKANHQR
jgi:hypothetical protein